MKRLGIICIVLVFLFNSTLAAHAESRTDRISTNIPNAGPGGYTRFAFNSLSMHADYSLQPNSQHKNFISVLPVCTTQTDSECIESLAYKKKNEKNWTQATLLPRKNPNIDGKIALTYTNDGSTQTYGKVSKDTMQARPYGDTSSNWELKGANHVGGNEYLLSVYVSNLPRGYVQNAYDFGISLEAISWKTKRDFGDYDSVGNLTSKFNIPEDFDFQVKVRLGIIENRIINWYTARIAYPEIDLSNGLLTVSGRPSYIPVAGTEYFKCSEISAERRFTYEARYGISFLEGSMCNDGAGSTSTLIPRDGWAFQIFDSWESDIKEYGKNSAWAIEATSNLGTCSNSQLAGFVSSNALLYSVDPPNFDKLTRNLSYRIASTHLDSKGNLNKGRFNLTINKTVAECLWGIKAVNLAEAKVDVTYADGKPVIGTTSMKVSGDWVYINIENFSFSSPTFNIKAVEKESSDVKPTSTSSVSPSPAPMIFKKLTIICVKGKRTKIVTSNSPKCPVGYKKK
jgi:hypothetical protein